MNEFEQGKELLLKALKEKQKKIQHVKGPDPEKEKNYLKMIEKFEEQRGGKLFYPYIGSGLGNGSLVELLDGSVKYDMITGIGVHIFGHGDLSVAESSLDAALSDTVMEGHLQQNLDAVELTELLLKISGMDHCFLSSTGVMANENGFKIAFQNRFPATRILAFEHCFLGRTLSLAQVTDKPSFRHGLPVDLAVDYIPFDPETALERLEEHLERYPCQHALMTFELVQGEGGFNVGSKELFIPLMKKLKEHKILIHVDEVQTFGRLEKPFAFQHFGLEEYVDIVSIGKLSQACATLFRSAVKPKPGLLSQTFTTSASAMRASKVLIEKLEANHHFGKEGRNNQVFEKFSSRLKALPFVKGPFGIGGMIAFTPLSGEGAEVQKFVQDLFRAGVISFTCGSNPTRCRFLPPLLAITDEEIDGAMDIVETVLRSTYDKHR